MANLGKYIYVVGPDAKKNSEFISNHLAAELSHAPDIIKSSTEMIEPEDSIVIYAIVNENNEWLFHYTRSSLTNVVLVKDF